LILNQDNSYINVSGINNITNDNIIINPLPIITRNVNNFNKPTAMQRDHTPVKYKKITLKNNNIINRKIDHEALQNVSGVVEKVLNNFRREQPKKLVNHNNRSKIKNISPMKY
jgi:hypothetical protein